MRIDRPKSLTQLVVEELRTRIIEGRLALGAPLSENVLAAELGMSKTPVREALLQLRSEGLIDVLPQRGSYVFRISTLDVGAISELRRILEMAAAELAVVRNGPALAARMQDLLTRMGPALERDDRLTYHRLDGEFHEAIVALAGNVFLAEAYGQIAFRIQALRSRLSSHADLNRSSLEDHGAMLALVEAGDGAGLAAVLARHVAATEQAYLKLLETRNLLEEGPDGA
ncbi:DNA-binding transcriptional regulator, GntR family [Devosia enhydra]|uniref:DNA-binding transcriptional regulator, GntR family n=1 Tax=Devosia enhydra TaxID=665118 RepID=A0A1K2I3I3_9HYPH|nr:GntR family transcriptional regulator [Devosia enhydra]SFZ86791.1 DNA-binding transcriptional regulator, GntR family [Devosia enhydra]